MGERLFSSFGSRFRSSSGPRTPRPRASRGSPRSRGSRRRDGERSDVVDDGVETVLAGGNVVADLAGRDGLSDPPIRFFDDTQFWTVWKQATARIGTCAPFRRLHIVSSTRLRWTHVLVLSPRYRIVSATRVVPMFESRLQRSDERRLRGANHPDFRPRCLVRTRTRLINVLITHIRL